MLTSLSTGHQPDSLQPQQAAHQPVIMDSLLPRELLLLSQAFALHGTAHLDAVASAMHARTAAASRATPLTPQACLQILNEMLAAEGLEAARLPELKRPHARTAIRLARKYYTARLGELKGRLGEQEEQMRWAVPILSLHHLLINSSPDNSSPKRRRYTAELGIQNSQMVTTSSPSLKSQHKHYTSIDTVQGYFEMYDRSWLLRERRSRHQHPHPSNNPNHPNLKRKLPRLQKSCTLQMK